MNTNRKQTNIFDFLNEEIQIQNIEVPNIQIDKLLERMKSLIEKGIIKQTDKYFRLSFSIQPTVEKSAYTDEFILVCLAWSDSAVYNDVYEKGGKILKYRRIS
jgi:predicted transcriptional regulator